MNSRERILKSINHQEPDRVPVDLGGTPSTSISAIAYHNLKQHLEIKEGHTRIYDLMQQLAYPEDVIMDVFKVDTFDIGRAFNTNDEDWRDVEVNGIPAQFPSWFTSNFNEDGSIDVFHPDGTRLAGMSEAALVIDQTYYPCEEQLPQDINELIQALSKNYGYVLVNPPYDHLTEGGFWRTLKKKVKNLRESTDKALCFSPSVSFFQFGNSLKPLDKFLVDMIRHPQKMDKFFDVVLDFQLTSLMMSCKSVGTVVDVVYFGDDYGENNGPLFSPRLFRKFIKPRLEAVCDYVKKHSSMKILMHSCGSIVPIIPDLIEVGIDILNPIQISAKGMDPKFLKETYGDDLAFWGGGADTRNVLPFKPPEQVKAHVKGLLEIFAPGGGYIWNTIHNILPDVPPQNILAMFDAIEEFNNDYY